MGQSAASIKTVCVSLCLATVITGCSNNKISPGMQVGSLPMPGETTQLPDGSTLVQADLTHHAVPQAPAITPVPSDVYQLFNRKTSPTYLLAKGDLLAISLWAYPEITPPNTVVNTSGYVIDQSGRLNFPLIGAIQAEGLTIEQLGRNMSKRLAKYLKQPDVQIRAMQYNGRKYNVDGEVKQPGQFPLNDQQVTLYTALSNAGGTLATSDINRIELTRKGHTYHLSLLALQHAGLSPTRLFLQEGDTIHVFSKENRKVYLIGEAGNPNAFTMPDEGMTLASVLGEGRGLNPNTASSSRVYVIRSTSRQTTVYQLDMSTLASLATAQRFQMQPNDYVYIDATGLARWNRILGLILPSSALPANLVQLKGL